MAPYTKRASIPHKGGPGWLPFWCTEKPFQQLLTLPLTAPHTDATIPLESRTIALGKALSRPRPEFIPSTDHLFVPRLTFTKITSFNINGFINKKKKMADKGIWRGVYSSIPMIKPCIYYSGLYSGLLFQIVSQVHFSILKQSIHFFF